ncbi:hypothetical protein BIW11_03289 [Tropilaelaps mercedesae]|uniref:Uncharacterized protein n=1 Tax=Tropilaelaps mercedesae TaxID=418985 RepID=A0A1V9XPC0_9ACAR|nr:hypothetical protein BIW11_03289 [Tropilaelaps mercedesae]
MTVPTSGRIAFASNAQVSQHWRRRTVRQTPSSPEVYIGAKAVQQHRSFPASLFLHRTRKVRRVTLAPMIRDNSSREILATRQTNRALSVN